MNSPINFKSILTHVAVILFFAAITLVYFSPLLKGKAIRQGDIIHFKGMSKEIVDFREKHNGEPLWTNSMFGGMPAYQISTLYPGNLIRYVDKLLTFGLPHPSCYVFLYLLGFYILLQSLRINQWASVFGALAFAFSSYLFIILEAGHNSKAHAIAYMAPVFAGVILTFRGQYLLGGALTALFLALEIMTNHLQITYYLMLILIIYGIIQVIHVSKTKDYNAFFKSVGVLLFAAVLGIACNITTLWATYDYGKYTIRGKSELTFDKENKTSGLDRDYATNWSYGKAETMSLLIPNFKGGASGSIGQNKTALKNVDERFRQSVAGADQYWGDQPFTSGPVYAGAIVCFLFVLGLLIVNGRIKWFLIVITLLSIVLAWGKNFMDFTNFFLDYVPGYNKFRAVSMILVIAGFAIPLLAALALDRLSNHPDVLNEKIRVPFINDPVTKRKLFFVSFGLTAGLALLFYLLPGLTEFTKANEYEQMVQRIKQSNTDVSDQQIAEYVDGFLPQLEEAREAIFKADALRSFFMILLAAAALWMYLKVEFNKNVLFILLILFLLMDMWMVNKRYLNEESFVAKREVQNPYKASAANLAILEDKDPNFRVLNLAVDPFSDASTSYFHKSIGGYHGAKLKRYQELIEFHISGEMQDIINGFRNNPSDSSLNALLARQNVLNMLNTRYIIYNPEAPPLINRNALGNAWFVRDYKLVANADSEIVALSSFDPAVTAIIDQRYRSELEGLSLRSDPAATIKLTHYNLNHLIYESKAAHEQLSVFSEIYYKSGWNAYIDGELKPHFAANYVLRAMRVPPGNHKIEFKFEPEIYVTGEKVSRASSALLLILVIGAAIAELRKRLGNRERQTTSVNS